MGRSKRWRKHWTCDTPSENSGKRYKHLEGEGGVIFSRDSRGEGGGGKLVGWIVLKLVTTSS